MSIDKLKSIAEKRGCEWYLNPVIGYKCEVNEDGIGEKIYVKNQGSVEDFREWQALDKKYVGFDNHACLIEMCEKLREQLAEYIAKFGEIKK